MLKVPAFFFPTSTILIDDDRLYAKLFIDSLEDDHRIEIIEDIGSIIAQANDDFLFIGEKPQNILNTIEKCIEERKSALDGMISVVIADFHMEGMTGLELFKKLKSPFIYKILISNFIDERFKAEISDAQNAGVIHAVLRKGESLKNELPKAILKGQQKFFAKIGSVVYRHALPQNCLADTIFSDHFLKLMDEHNPEYIWPKEDFSVFTLENRAKTEKKQIFITTPDEIETLLEGYNSKSALAKTIAALKTGDFMVCHENPHMIEGEEWAFHLRPAKKICGTEATYLYNLLEV